MDDNLSTTSSPYVVQTETSDDKIIEKKKGINIFYIVLIVSVVLLIIIVIYYIKLNLDKKKDNFIQPVVKTTPETEYNLRSELDKIIRIQEKNIQNLMLN